MLKKYFLKERLLVGICFILLGAPIAVYAEESKLLLSVEDINALIPYIEAAERKLLNIKVESETWLETKTDPCEPWQRTPVYTSCTAWFDGKSKGKARVDVHKQVLKWVDGAAPYGEESFSLSFDGQNGRVVNQTSGHSGKTHLSKRGKLLQEVPPQLESNYVATGAKFSLYFFFNDEEGDTFSQYFRVAISPAALEAKAFEVSFEEFQGVECVRFGTGEQTWGHISWRLDPSRGFALLGYENVNKRDDGSEKIMSRIKVTKLEEVAPGVWWPIEASIESDPDKLGEPYQRTVYRASNIVANASNFDESIFTISFPEGCLIDDKMTGKKYKVGPNGEQLIISDSNEPN